MVTAGFHGGTFVPMFSLSPMAMNVIVTLGQPVHFLGLIGVVQNDIKRVVAYLRCHSWVI